MTTTSRNTAAGRKKSYSRGHTTTRTQCVTPPPIAGMRDFLRLPAHRSRLVAEFVRCLEGEIEIEYCFHSDATRPYGARGTRQQRRSGINACRERFAREQRVTGRWYSRLNVLSRSSLVSSTSRRWKPAVCTTGMTVGLTSMPAQQSMGPASAGKRQSFMR